MADYYPIWLGQFLIEGDPLWTQFQTINLPDFLAIHHLHDSSWIGLYHDSDFEATAIIRWDTFWLKDKSYYQWPILLIRFERSYQVQASRIKHADQIGSCIANATCQPIEEKEREKMFLNNSNQTDDMYEFMFDETLHRTIFLANFGSQVEIIHGGKVDILCLTRDKKVLPLPNEE